MAPTIAPDHADSASTIRTALRLFIRRRRLSFRGTSDERGTQFARLGVILRLKLTHAGGEPIVRGLQGRRFVAVIDRPRRFERGDAENAGFVRANPPVFAVMYLPPLSFRFKCGNAYFK